MRGEGTVLIRDMIRLYTNKNTHIDLYIVMHIDRLRDNTMTTK